MNTTTKKPRKLHRNSIIAGYENFFFGRVSSIRGVIASILAHNMPETNMEDPDLRAVADYLLIAERHANLAAIAARRYIEKKRVERKEARENSNAL